VLLAFPRAGTLVDVTEQVQGTMWGFQPVFPIDGKLHAPSQFGRAAA